MPAFRFGHCLLVARALHVFHVPDVIAVIDALHRVNRHEFNSSAASERHVDVDQIGLRRRATENAPEVCGHIRLARPGVQEDR